MTAPSPRYTGNSVFGDISARAGARPVSRAVATERLVIGTAAFGQPYGATNPRGQVPETVAGEVIERASALGIDTIDTAPAYGEAETLLGRLPQAKRFSVVTKFNLQGETKGWDPAAAVVEGLGRSLRDLDRRKVDALLLHRGSDLLGPHGGDLLRGLLQAKTNGLAGRVGVSIYDGDEVDGVLSRFRPDIVQVPLSVVDQRLITGGHLARLAELGVEVHARSAFLQGLLLAPERRPGWAADCPHLLRFDEKCAASDLTALQICLGFLLSRPDVQKIVVGATSVEELDAIVEAANDPATERSWPSFALTNTPLLDPRRWPNQFPDNRKSEPTPN